MKRKISLFLMLIMFTFSSVNFAYASNDGVTTLKLNADIKLYLPEGYQKGWLSLDITEDDVYSFEFVSNGGLSISLYDRQGTEIGFIGNPEWNDLKEKYIHKGNIFLHKGSYLVGVNSNTDDVNLTVKIIKSNNNNVKDFEALSDTDTILPLQFNTKTQGAIYGFKATTPYKDENDWYEVKINTAGKYQVTGESTIECYLHLFKDSDLNRDYWGISSNSNQLKKKYILDGEFQIDEPGLYYVRISTPYQPSIFQDNGTGIISNMNFGFYEFQIFSDSYAENPVSTKAPATISTPVGVKINWENTDNTGFRVYRAEAGGVPVAVSGIVYGNSFVDVNVESGKKYYYMVVPENESSVPVVDEKTSSEAVTETILQPENTGIKNFILMKIGNPNMTVGDKVLEIDPGRGTAPIIQNGRTLVPIRAIIEAMNGTVDWNESERKVTLNANGHNVQMWLGKKEFIVDGVTKQMDIAPDTINDRTMLPIRFATENVGCQIEWIGSTQEIIIVF